MPLIPLAAVKGSVVTTGATPVVALRNDPSRLGVVLSNTGTNAITLSPLGEGRAVPTILLPVGSSPIIVRAELMGQLATCGMMATSSSGVSSLGITEVILLE